MTDHRRIFNSKGKTGMQFEDSFAIVQAWQDAANFQNMERLLELSDPNIEIIGPQGSGYGHQLLRDWLSRAGLSLTTMRMFECSNTLVLAQHGVWRSLNTGAVTGEADVASRFRVDGQQVTQIARYDSLDTALDEAGLDYSNEITQP